MKPRIKIHKITKQVLEAIHIPDGSNLVLIHITHQNKDSRTGSGILVVGDEDYKPAHHAERWGYVYRLPPSLSCDKDNPSTLRWDTDMECEVGDKVWFDFRAAAYAKTFECEGDWYKLLRYDSLHVAKREEEVIPLNGYMMMDEYTPQTKGGIILQAEPNKDFGIVRYLGTPNREYVLDVWDDDIEVNIGDHVLFEAGTACFPLEADVHQEFSKTKYLMQQRKRIVAVVDDTHEEVIRIHAGVVGVKARPEQKEKGGITLLKTHEPTRTCDVVVSAHPDIPVGSVCVVSPQKGTGFKDIEYLTEDKILFYAV